jgi:hypothetical protein
MIEMLREEVENLRDEGSRLTGVLQTGQHHEPGFSAAFAMKDGRCSCTSAVLFSIRLSKRKNKEQGCKAAVQARLITVTSGLALSLTGVKVVPIPRLT